MDIKELKGLMEAYSEVYVPLDEAIRNPESRKKLRDIEGREVRKGDKSIDPRENPRSKYQTEKGKLASHLLRGREETGSKGNPVRSRGGTSAPADERVGKGPARAGNAAYWASVAGPTRDRGAGNKAARRAAALRQEELDIFDIVLEFLQVEGYAETLEEAEWIMANLIDEEAVDILLGEEQLDEADSLAAMQVRREKRQKANIKKHGTPGFDYSKPHSGKKGYLDTITKKESFEEWFVEAMSNYEKNRKRAAQRAAARNEARKQGKTGAVPGVGYVTPRREKETWTDERGKTRHAKGL